MSRKFCPKCGKITKDFYENLCEECYLAESKILDKLPDEITIALCKECRMNYVKNKRFKNLESVVSKLLKKINSICSATYRITNNKLFVNIYFKINGIKGQKEKTIKIKQPKIICKFCNMKFSGYFNSVLQLRGSFKQDKILNEIKNIIEQLKNDDSLSFISNIAQKTNGIDVYIGSKSAANKIANKLKNRYKTKNKITRKLYGKIGGKSTYRDTILILFSE